MLITFGLGILHPTCATERRMHWSRFAKALTLFPRPRDHRYILGSEQEGQEVTYPLGHMSSLKLGRYIRPEFFQSPTFLPRPLAAATARVCARRARSRCAGFSARFQLLSVTMSRIWRLREPSDVVLSNCSALQWAWPEPCSLGGRSS